MLASRLYLLHLNRSRQLVNCYAAGGAAGRIRGQHGPVFGTPSAGADSVLYLCRCGKGGVGSYWKAFECSHNYNDSPYYDGDATAPRSPPPTHTHTHTLAHTPTHLHTYLPACTTSCLVPCPADTSTWEGYDTDAQTDDVCRWLRGRHTTVPAKPFLAALSWGAPSNDLGTAMECCSHLTVSPLGPPDGVYGVTNAGARGQH